MNAARAVKIAKALSDPTRYRMLGAIRAAGELNCSNVCELFPLSQPTISHHVQTLEEAGVITVRKQSQYHILAAREEVLAEFASLLAPAPKKPAGSPAKSSAARVPASARGAPRTTPARRGGRKSGS